MTWLCCGCGVSSCILLRPLCLCHLVPLHFSTSRLMWLPHLLLLVLPLLLLFLLLPLTSHTCHSLSPHLITRVMAHSCVLSGCPRQLPLFQSMVVHLCSKCWTWRRAGEPRKSGHESSRYIDGGAKGAHRHRPVVVLNVGIDGKIGVSQHIYAYQCQNQSIFYTYIYI